MHTAWVISKYPERYLVDKIIPKLVDYGIVVQYITHPDRVLKTTCYNVDVVILMHEMVDHSTFYRFKTFFAKQDKQLILLSRKSSAWSKEPTMSALKTTNQTNILPLVHKVIELRKQGCSFDDIASQVSGNMWKTTSPTGKNLSTFLSYTLMRGCPEALRSELKSVMKRQPAPKAPAEKKQLTFDHAATTIPAPPESSPEQDNAEMAKLYEEENMQLHAKVAALQAELTELRRAAKKNIEAVQTPAMDILRQRALLVSIQKSLADAAQATLELEKVVK